MELKDFLITPIYLLVFTCFAYIIRPYVTNEKTRKFFLPALLIRFIGAIAVGLVYQFYYSGGDTFSYYNQAGIIWEALNEDFSVGLSLIFGENKITPDNYKYASQIYWFRFTSEYTMIRIIGFLSFFTHYTYSSISIFFAVFSFAGVWSAFSVLQKSYPKHTLALAFSVLFIPTTVFWGSGILKDTVTLGAVGLAFASAYKIIEIKKLAFKNIAVLILAMYLVLFVKIYILLCLIPSLLLWWYFKNLKLIKTTSVRVLIAPLLLTVFMFFGYNLLEGLTSDSDRYNLNSLAKWAHVTSHDIRYWTGKDAGSGYDIGEQDGTWEKLIVLAPAAINVSLFRPYLWEVKNPLMLLASLEALFLLLLTVRAFLNFKFSFMKEPIAIFLLVFSLTFAFAVGSSTYNFGSLNRYKIPLIPFYTTLVFLQFNKKALDNRLYTRVDTN